MGKLQRPLRDLAAAHESVGVLIRQRLAPVAVRVDADLPLLPGFVLLPVQSRSIRVGLDDVVCGNVAQRAYAPRLAEREPRLDSVAEVVEAQPRILHKRVDYELPTQPTIPLHLAPKHTDPAVSATSREMVPHLAPWPTKEENPKH